MMSHKEQKPQEQVLTAEKSKLAKVILYIAVFLVLVRCDLWVSLVVLVVVCVYLGQSRLIKALVNPTQNAIGRFALMAQVIALQWYAQHVDQKQVAKTPSADTENEEPKPVHQERPFQEVSTVMPIASVEDISQAPQEWFHEDRFGDIWRDYPQEDHL